MRALLLALALLCLAPFASAAVLEDAIGITFPDEIAGLKLEGRKSFPQKALGSVTGYEGTDLVHASVYVYTGGLGSIPDGTESSAVQKHLAQVLDEAKQMQSLGKARRVTIPSTPPQITPPASCGPRFVWQAFEMDIDGTVITSYTYLTGMKNNFVKLRLRHASGDTAGKQDVARFVAGVSKVLGRC